MKDSDRFTDWDESTIDFDNVDEEEPTTPDSEEGS